MRRRILGSYYCSSVATVLHCTGLYAAALPGRASLWGGRETMLRMLFLCASLSVVAAVPQQQVTVRHNIQVAQSFGGAMLSNDKIYTAVVDSVSQRLGLDAEQITIQVNSAGTRRMQSGGLPGYTMQVTYQINCGDFGAGQSECGGVQSAAEGLSPPFENANSEAAANQAAQNIIESINMAATASGFPGNSAVRPEYTFGTAEGLAQTVTAPTQITLDPIGKIICSSEC